MTKNPFYNAVIAAGYIAILVSAINLMSRLLSNRPDNMLMPMSMLALLVLSVAFMAYAFFYEPVLMFIDNRRSEGLKLFFRTLGIFAVITVLYVLTSVYLAL